MDNFSRNRRPMVSIVVLNWNGMEVTRECLDSLAEVTYPNFNVILVDNGSSDGSQWYFKEKYPWVSVIETGRNLGFAGGSNAGIRAALQGAPDYVLLLNNDTVADPSFLDELVEAGELRVDAGILGPKIYYFDRPGTIWYAGGSVSLFRGASVHFGFREADKGQHERGREVNFITGCALLIRREVIENIGMLDETFFCYSEDADWCIRAAKAGYKGWYAPAARVWHKDGMSSRKRRDGFSMRMGTRNIAYLIHKHASGWRSALCYGSCFITWLLPTAVKCLLKGRLTDIAGMWDGLHEFWEMDKTGGVADGRCKEKAH